MKKIVRLLLIAICASPMVMAQNYDDLYYNPKKDTSEIRKVKVRERKVPSATTDMPVIVKDRNGNIRDVDEYNRRYDSNEYDFNVNNDTLYVEENEDRGWINGFEGSQSDYDYAMRIIRFRDPRFAVSISSPYYWDLVYGMSAWEWNIYVDDFYAYAFPTFTNRLWSDWRFGSLGRGWNWNFGFGFDYGWGYPYYGGYYPGYWGGYYGGYWGHSYYGGWYDPWYGGGGRPIGGHYGGYYNTRRSDFGVSGSRDNFTSRRTSGYSRLAGAQDRTSTTVGRRTASGRVVGTRTNDNTGVIRRTEGTRFESVNTDRTNGSSRRGSSYTRPSSTRTYSPSSDGTVRRGSTFTRPESTTPTRSYNRGSSTAPTRSYSPGEGSSRRTPSPSTYDNSSRSSSSSSRSYSPSSSSSRSESSGSSRSGGGSSDSGSSRSSGGRR